MIFFNDESKTVLKPSYEFDLVASGLWIVGVTMSPRLLPLLPLFLCIIAVFDGNETLLLIEFSKILLSFTVNLSCSSFEKSFLVKPSTKTNAASRLVNAKDSVRPAFSYI